MSKPIVEYPTGRYECAQCGEAILVTEVSDTLPACPSCGGRDYKGQAPKVTIPEPPPPPKFDSGMYQCSACGDRTMLAEATDALPACTLCGAPLESMQ